MRSTDQQLQVIMRRCLTVITEKTTDNITENTTENITENITIIITENTGMQQYGSPQKKPKRKETERK